MSSENISHPKLTALWEKQHKELMDLLKSEHKIGDVHKLAAKHNKERNKLIKLVSKSQAA